MRIAFDVDGTLIKKTRDADVPRYEIIQVLLTLESLGHVVFVWSGGGVDYATQWCYKLGLPSSVRVIPKTDGFDIDLAFDDQDFILAKCVVKV